MKYLQTVCLSIEDWDEDWGCCWAIMMLADVAVEASIRFAEAAVQAAELAE